MDEWSCEQVGVTRASRGVAWAFLTNFDNHLEETSVERIELDGRFLTGTRGRTIMTHATQEWTLEDVVSETHFAIVGQTPDERGTLSFSWSFTDVPGGTRITYQIAARGPHVQQDAQELEGMGRRAPHALQELIARLDQSASSD